MDTLVFQNIIIAMVFGFAIGLQREMKILYENKNTTLGVREHFR